jgi:hypothetical protein
MRVYSAGLFALVLAAGSFVLHTRLFAAAPLGAIRGCLSQADR